MDYLPQVTGACVWALAGLATWAGERRVAAKQQSGWWWLGLGGVLFIVGLTLFKVGAPRVIP
jgi:hypothetical protein